MRDLVVRESLRNLAEEASERFGELVRSGEEVPYEVREPGQGSPLATYAPLTAQFIRERATMISRLDAFAAAKAAIAAAGLATAYLESLGAVLAPSEARRAEDAIVAFLCRLWDGRSDFDFERSRVDEAISKLEACADAREGEVEVVVPLVGLLMPATRLELAGATIMRADVVEAPPEALFADGLARAGWEPQFLATTRCDVADLEAEGAGEEEAATAPLAERFRNIVTALRLFKPGGVGLGPHAWVRAHGGRWRRISTGAGRPRSGAYRLAESELGGLAGLTRALQRAGGRPAGLERAISRFEAGLDRGAVLEALNDHLLSLRFLLEGEGPAKTEMSWRVAALCAEPAERDAVRATVDQALALERQLWSGDPPPAGDARTPVEVAGEIEDFARAILRDAACGHLGSDLRATADEILLADGLAAGEGDASQRGETSEWGLGEQPEIAVEADAEPEAPRPKDPQTIELEAVDAPIQAELSEQPDRAGAEPPPSDATPPRRPQDGWIPFALEEETEDEPASPEPEAPEQEQETELERGREASMEPLRSTPDDPMPTFSFPKREPGPAMRLLDQRPEERKAIRARVSNLFPEPETTDWSVTGPRLPAPPSPGERLATRNPPAQTDDARQPVADRVRDRVVILPQAVVAGDRDHGPVRARARHPELVPIALDDQRRHRDRVELGLAGLLRAAGGMDRERQAEHRDRFALRRGPAGHPRAGGAAADDQRQPLQLAAAKVLDHGGPRGIESCGCGEERFPVTR